MPRSAAGIRARALFLAFPFCLGLRGQATETSDPKRLFEHGQRALAAANYGEAERDFNRLLKMGVGTAPVYTNLGVTYLRTGKIENALRVFKKAKALAPGMTGVDLNLGLAYYRLREFQQAAPYFTTVVLADPANVQARYLKGLCHFMMDQFEAAIDAFGPIHDRQQNDLECLFMLGISYGKVKRPADAERTFARLVEAGGETPHLHFLLGKAYLALDDYQKAQTELEKAAANGSRLPYAHYYLGVLYEKMGKFDTAAAEYAQETEISPDDHWAYEDLARLKLQEGHTNGAISILETADARIRDSASLLSALAKAYLQKSDADRAIRCLRRALELEPNNGSYHYQLGRAYEQAGRRNEGHAEMTKARALQVEVLRGQMEALSRDAEHETGTGSVR
jgi:Flp pilus assembly protein TadD